MALILNIETATTVCSVSLSRQGKQIFLKELDEGFTHAENLHGFILEALESTGHKTKDLNAIAVSKGPGSYTGLRIGVSAAKGLAYALKIPLIGVDTLQVMANAALTSLNKEVYYCPMIDARRMEVYTAVYDSKLNLYNPIEALIIDPNSVQKFAALKEICFFGDGMQKCKSILEAHPNSLFLENIKPSARFMTELTYAKFLKQDFEDVAYFEPFYLKDFMIGKKKDS